jgi:hypothetical protein
MEGSSVAETSFRKNLSLAIGFAAASLSGAAILLAAFGWMTLVYSVTISAPLAAVLFTALWVRAGRASEHIFLDRVRGGLLAGVLGLLAYDLVRLLVLSTHLVPFNPFRPIEVFGLLILDRYQDSLTTKLVGWLFHTWNGLSFALMYTLAFGRGRIAWAMAWALLLETAMLATYPSLFHVVLAWPFVTISLIGHLAYGAAIGWAAQKYISA